jgi:uncharacterized protein YndB with AHSA1/START domain
MDIDRSAPVLARSEIRIASDPETVWATLTDFSGWPGWKTDIRSMRFDGRLEPGTTFRWKAGGVAITSTLREIDPPASIAWTGSAFGIAAVDTFRLRPVEGGTEIVEEESWPGLLPRLLRSRLAWTLQSSLDQGLQSLKAEAERRASAGRTAA